MRTKPKACKGTGKAKGRGCGNVTSFRRYGLCQGCFADWLINTKEGKETLNRAKITGKKRADKVIKKQKREEREGNKSIQKLIQEARIPFHRWIRFRDANKPCISCGSVDSKIWDAGHFKKAEIYTGMIFDERNVHKQCRKCNSFLNGNEGEYRKRLIQLFGSEWVEVLDEDADALRLYSWTRSELRDIKKLYSDLLKEQLK